MERIDVVAAIVEHDGLFLACRRRPERGGQWEFPGGKVESGESVDAAV
ncbi:MAG: NUDIX domain-containing protein, partial [Actinobacteria bacterium]|nr:NUDIX domain-containing protein [Actinomycetota bacterium]